MYIDIRFVVKMFVVWFSLMNEWELLFLFIFVLLGSCKVIRLDGKDIVYFFMYYWLKKWLIGVKLIYN